MKKKIMFYLFNMALNYLLNNDTVQNKQKNVIRLLNTIIDSLRDFKLTPEEVASIQNEFNKLFNKGE